MQQEGKASPSAAESARRLARLRSGLHENTDMSRASQPRNVFQQACATDLLFLIDTTSSMDPYLEAAKEQVVNIVRGLKDAFYHRAPLRVGVVSYKDHCDFPNVQYLDFTPDIDRVLTFLRSLCTSGGGDTPEDVLGALQGALNTSWKSHTRCIIHITDAPAHGRTLHDLNDVNDEYAEPGSEPHRLRHSSILQKMISKNINYALLRINDSTDRMAYVFHQAYAAVSPDCVLLASNKYAAQVHRTSNFSRAGFQGWTLSAQQAPKNIKFIELQLGTFYHSLGKLVISFVTTSVTNSATFNSPATISTQPSSLASFSSSSGVSEGVFSSHSTTRASSRRDTSSIALEDGPPLWDTPGWLNETIEFAAYSTEVLAHGDSVLDNMMSSRDNIVIHTTNLTVSKRARPFAAGAMRLASYARSGVSQNKLVVKTYMRESKSLLHLTEDMCAQALCKAFALEFNAMLSEEYSLDFIVVTCLEEASEAGKAGAKCMSLEPLIRGDYIKYNSNQGWVNKDNEGDPTFQAAQAFSHFTYERSKGLFMVTDLQGVGRVLTDPALQTWDPNYLPLAGGNICHDGFCFFFLTHECNVVCRQLGLLSSHDMLTTGNYTFRTTWPAQREVANMLVCCSNKLCSRIVRMAKAKTSVEFPGYRWCYNCWLQLESTTVKIVCTARGPLHDFKLSRFFYESQGRILPRLCPKHYVDGSAPSPAIATAASTPSGPRVPACRFGDGCTDMSCAFMHSVPPCPTGAACKKADCAFRHPNKLCRYKDACEKSECPFRHPGGRYRPAWSGSASSPTAATHRPRSDCTYGADCTNMDCTFQHPVSICGKGANCTKKKCHQRHPKSPTKCRDGAECIKPGCIYEHPEHH